MSVKIIDSDRDFHVYTYMIDSEEDLSSIPDNVDGSVALSAETGRVYIMNTKGEWKEL